MALELQKTITLPNLNEITGVYWRVYSINSYVDRGGNESTSIGLELWESFEARNDDDIEPLTTTIVTTNELIISRSSAYNWIKDNVDGFENSIDV